ncbi:MAG TPA: pyridoxamine 5'-phosphate oxidase [Acidimicrobiia bacterium]|nr:pyridoxamine 5'-phosphate oxidase [Acidimicrobiia bacterium]
MIREEAARLRNEYESIGLDGPDMAEDPVTEFQAWFAGALAAQIHEPNAFVLATVDADGTPSARAVLMKDLSEAGLVFYTGMASRKSEAMRSHPLAAATFVWTPLHRQVRFEGEVAPVSDEEADAYFSSRPRGAQIAAHASLQSSLVADRDELDRRFTELSNELGEDVPRPEHWGGWRLSPRVVEFWQGRPNRFHDRIRYRRDGSVWVKERLAP